jgi:hypothetical protein
MILDAAGLEFWESTLNHWFTKALSLGFLPNNGGALMLKLFQEVSGDCTRLWVQQTYMGI